MDSSSVLPFHVLPPLIPQQPKPTAEKARSGIAGTVLYFMGSPVAPSLAAAFASRVDIHVLTPLRVVRVQTVSYTHLRAHETRHDLVCRLLLEKKKKKKK